MFKNIFNRKAPKMDLNKIKIDSEASIHNDGILIQSFGIRIYDGSIAPFSQMGESYPAKGSYTFSTDEDLQDQITLEFHRSDETQACQSSFIGVVKITGYALEEAGEPLVRVHYSLENNEISIWATNEKNNGEIFLTLLKNQLGHNVH